MNFKKLNHLFALILFVIIAVQNCFATDENNFENGITAYKAKRFDEAATAFAKSFEEKPASGTLLNLGLAEWQRGNAGAAILFWQRAAWLDPFNRDARKNLSFARESSDVNAPSLNWFERTSVWLPTDYWAWITTGSLWLGVGLMTLPNVFRLRKKIWHQTFAALAFAIFLLSLPPTIGIVTRSNVGFVLQKNTPLRQTPTRDAEIANSLDAGEAVRQLRTRGNFIFVQTANGNGWIERGQIGLIYGK